MHTYTHTLTVGRIWSPAPATANSPSGMLNVFCCILPESRRKLHFFSVLLISTVADLKRSPGNCETLNLNWKRQDEKNLFSTKIKESERTVYIIGFKLCFILKSPSAISACIQHAGFHHGSHFHYVSGCWQKVEYGLLTSRRPLSCPRWLLDGKSWHNTSYQFRTCKEFHCIMHISWIDARIIKLLLGKARL